MINVIPQPKKISYFQRVYLYDGETVHTALDSMLGEEEYILQISADEGINIIGGSEKAVFYGESTLEQILVTNTTRLPAMKIEDEPKFAYRGFLIDCSRHFFDVEELKAMVDMMAKLKYNKFHWHLSDDQGFRMEIESLPKLHKEASERMGSNFGRKKSNKIYGGYYTKAQMKEMVKFCAERHIDIVPELDIPGHSSAIIHAYPEISCRGKRISVKTTQGIFKDILCAGKEETYDYIFNILDEMCEIFPGKYFHIGGDEVPKTYWANCPDCKDKMREQGFEDFEQLQGYMMNRVAAYLERKGKTVICWNDALKGENLEPGIVTEHWLDRSKRTLKRAGEGKKVIMSDFYHTYFDYPYAITPLKKTFNFNPYFKKSDLRGRESVEGVECCLWTEHIDSNARLEYMAFPRAAALAEVGWGQGKKSYRDFKNALKNLCLIMKRNRIRFAPKSDWDPNIFKRVVGTLGFLNEIKSTLFSAEK